MRKVKTSSLLGVYVPGFTSKGIHSRDIKEIAIDSWAFMFHKPYTADWKEATEKAKERVSCIRRFGAPDLD